MGEFLRLVAFNVGTRIVEWSEREDRTGDVLIDHVKSRWQALRSVMAK